MTAQQAQQQKTMLAMRAATRRYQAEYEQEHKPLPLKPKPKRRAQWNAN